MPEIANRSCRMNLGKYWPVPLKTDGRSGQNAMKKRSIRPKLPIRKGFQAQMAGFHTNIPARTFVIDLSEPTPKMNKRSFRMI